MSVSVSFLTSNSLMEPMAYRLMCDWLSILHSAPSRGLRLRHRGLAEGFRVLGFSGGSVSPSTLTDWPRRIGETELALAERGY